MVRCDEGHLYDPAKHASCPWCGSGINLDAAAGKTVALRPQPVAGAAPPPPPAMAIPPQAPPMQAAARQATPAHAATVRLVEKEIGVNPVVGWLVATGGPMRGQDFTLHAEKNFIGRDVSMQVCLAKDSMVSRDKHASVVFEPKKRLFWLIPGDASGLVYRNGEVVNSPVLLADRDEMEVGGTKLVLVSFVNEAFQWGTE